MKTIQSQWHRELALNEGTDLLTAAMAATASKPVLTSPLISSSLIEKRYAVVRVAAQAKRRDCWHQSDMRTSDDRTRFCRVFEKRLVGFCEAPSSPI